MLAQVECGYSSGGEGGSRHGQGLNSGPLLPAGGGPDKSLFLGITLFPLL